MCGMGAWGVRGWLPSTGSPVQISERNKEREVCVVQWWTLTYRKRSGRDTLSLGHNSQRGETVKQSVEGDCRTVSGGGGGDCATVSGCDCSSQWHKLQHNPWNRLLFSQSGGTEEQSVGRL